MSLEMAESHLVNVKLDSNSSITSPSNTSTSSSARNRHRERKKDSKQVASVVSRVEDNSRNDKSDKKNMKYPDDPGEFISEQTSRVAVKEILQQVPRSSDTRQSTLQKPSLSVAVGSLEDVTDEEHYRINDFVKNEQITPYAQAFSPSHQKTASPNLVQIKARNSLLVKKELNAIKSQLRTAYSDASKAVVVAEPFVPTVVTPSLPTQSQTIHSIIVKTHSPRSSEHSSPADEFSKVLQKNNFSIMKMVDKLPLSAIKSDTPSQIQSIFSPFNFLECILAMTTRVISDTIHVTTLFRDNRLTNKMIDTFMSKEASSYLTLTLKPAVKIVLSSRDPFEIDPRYLGDESSLSENITHVLDMVSEITTSIYQSANRIPR